MKRKAIDSMGPSPKKQKTSTPITSSPRQRAVPAETHNECSEKRLKHLVNSRFSTDADGFSDGYVLYVYLNSDTKQEARRDLKDHLAELYGITDDGCFSRYFNDLVKNWQELSTEKNIMDRLKLSYLDDKVLDSQFTLKTASSLITDTENELNLMQGRLNSAKRNVIQLKGLVSRARQRAPKKK